MKRRLTNVFLFMLAVLVYAYSSYTLNYVQDDAFISYRYVANFLNGDGLVYNVGERVEGITNFGWVVLMSLSGSLGIDYIVFSRLFGFLCGIGLLWITWKIACEVTEKPDSWLAYLAVALVAFNISLAYWAAAGLETACFAFLAMTAFYLFLRQSRLLAAALVLAVWMRPEGALLAILFPIIEAITRRCFPLYSLGHAAFAFVLSLPYVIFKLEYYGSVLPNPFYAKTDFGLQQLVHGVEYTRQFLIEYGLFGAGFLIPLVMFRRLSRPAKAAWLIGILYVAYIVFIGGDVLEVHRFFITILPINSVLIVLSLAIITPPLEKRIRPLVIVLLAAVILGLTWYQPQTYVKAYRESGAALIHKMRFLARELKAVDTTDFTVALSTIGVFGYELVGHDIIDMVGLTDTTIARHPEPPIPGLTSQWREPKYNTDHLLTCAPDYILFSTGLKPTAPGEKALYLDRRFESAYRTIGWSYQPLSELSATRLEPIFRKMHSIPSRPLPRLPVAYIEYFKKGMDYYSVNDNRLALTYYDSALQIVSPPYNPYLRYRIGLSLLMLRDTKAAFRIMNELVADDSLVFEAHRELYTQARLEQDSVKAAVHERWLKRLVPWYWPRAQELANQRLQQLELMRRRQP